MFEVLERHKIPVAMYKVIKTEREAVGFFRKLRRPIALKAKTFEHKTEKGLVFLNLNNENSIKEAFQRIKEEGYDAIAQEMIKGVEVFVGGKYDEIFGYVITFGLGGIFVEIFKDISMRIWPFDEKEALEMINEIKSKKLLEGYRNFPKVDKKDLAKLIVNFGKMMEKEGYKEADLNPVICNKKGCFVVDFRCFK